MSSADRTGHEPAHTPAAQGAPPPSRPRPRSVPWWAVLLVCAIALASAWAGAVYGSRVAKGTRDALRWAAAAVGWRSDAPEDQADQSDDDSTYYTCGMHPWVILPHPGDCPICHMKLVPLDPAKFSGEVAIDPVVAQNIGVRVADVVEGPLVRTIRTVGTVDYDETRVRDVNTKVSGWIERLYIDYVGAPVRAGEPLMDVYSPTLYQAQDEYLLALRSGAGPEIVESAAVRLELLDVTRDQIRALADAGTPARTLTLLSPHTGVVIAKHANEGMRIDPGMQVFRIADLSRVWVLVSLYESHLPYIREGQRAVMSLPYIPGQTFEGRVAYIYPYVDTRTREVQVRLEFDNPAGLLKPGMFATVELRSTLRPSAVLAPRSAVLSTGRRDVAFVSLGEGRFEPRTVRLGAEADDDRVEILDGLSPGERVVVSAQFLLDSESRVREALAKMMRGEPVVEDTSAPAQAALASLPVPVADALSRALDAYLRIAGRLASDDAADLRTDARAIADAIADAASHAIPEDEHFWHRHPQVTSARDAADALADASTLPDARRAFSDLSIALEAILRDTGVPETAPASLLSLHCPMFNEEQGGATWLQPDTDVRNPYFGPAMLRCFDRREPLPVTPVGSAQPGDPNGLAPPLGAVLDTYLVLHDALARADTPAAQDALRSLRDAVDTSADDDLGARLRTALHQGGDDPARTLAALSEVLLEAARGAPLPTHDDGLYHVYCPMVEEHWIQPGRAVRNPYDTSMATCGVVKGRLDQEAGR